MNNVLVLGDTHADWTSTERIVRRYLRNNEDIRYILQVGDFGYWPQYNPNFPTALGRLLDKHDVTLYFADGNHEDHEALDKFPGPITHLDPTGRVRHVKRGEVLEFGNQRIMFFGGAVSVDRSVRTEGHDYFRREIPNWREWHLAYTQSDVDIIVSHDVPSESQPWYTKRDQDRWPEDVMTESRAFRDALSGLATYQSPRLWFAGHHHKRSTTIATVNSVEVTTFGEEAPQFIDTVTRFEVMGCDGQPFHEWAQIFDIDAPAGNLI